MNIGGAADARFEHAAVPDGNAVAGAEIVQPDRFSESANPTRLDVDDAARAGGDRVARRVHGLDRLVQADSRTQPPLERRVIRDVVVVEWLLDHHQIERIEPGKVIAVVDRVCRVCIDHQRYRPELMPNRRDGVDVPSRLDFDLDSPVAGGELGRYVRLEIAQRTLDADRDAGRDSLAR